MPVAFLRSLCYCLIQLLSHLVNATNIILCKLMGIGYTFEEGKSTTPGSKSVFFVEIISLLEYNWDLKQ